MWWLYGLYESTGPNWDAPEYAPATTPAGRVFRLAILFAILLMIPALLCWASGLLTVSFG